MVDSDQGGDEHNEGQEGHDVVFGKHGADDGAGSLVGGHLALNGGLDESEDDEQGDDKLVHYIFQ